MNGLYTQFKILLSKASLFMKLIDIQMIHIYSKSLLKYMQLHSFLNEGRTLDDSVSNYKGK